MKSRVHPAALVGIEVLVKTEEVPVAGKEINNY